MSECIIVTSIGPNSPEILGRYDSEDEAIEAWAAMNRSEGIVIEPGSEADFYIDNSDGVWIVPLPEAVSA